MFTSCSKNQRSGVVEVGASPPAEMLRPPALSLNNASSYSNSVKVKYINQKKKPAGFVKNLPGYYTIGNQFRPSSLKVQRAKTVDDIRMSRKMSSEMYPELPNYGFEKSCSCKTGSPHLFRSVSQVRGPAYSYGAKNDISEVPIVKYGQISVVSVHDFAR